VRKVVYAPWHAYLGHRFGYKEGTGPGWLSLFWWVALFHPGGRDELDALAMYLEAPASGARVLDVGCGSGKLLPQMRAMGWQAEGIEVDPKAVETAQKRGLPVKLGQLRDLSFPDAHFDAIHMSHVIEHVHDPAALLQECNRILKPGGRLVILTPNTLSYGYRRFGSSWLNLDPPRHLILFNRTNLRRLVEQQRFRIERLDSSVRTGWVYGALSRQIQRTNRGEMSDLGKASCLFHGLLYQWRARLERTRDPEAGDELVLIARKPA
jgi:methionine biosynthesis protein MetW